MSFFDNATETDETPLIQACWLTYDIPEKSGFPNPSGQLRPLAFRANLSCWVIQESDIPYVLIHEMRQAGADVHIVRFDASETPKLLKMACAAVERDIKQAVKAGQRNANAAVDRLRDADGDTNEAIKKYKNDQNRIIKDMGQKLKDLRAVARRFNIAARVPSLTASISAVGSLQATMDARAKAYYEAVQELEAHEGNTAVVRTAKASGMPGEILADYMDDTGLDGQKLRSRFFG